MFAATYILCSCAHQSLDEIRAEQTALNARLSALEEWQKTANVQIESMQSLIAALADNDYVTGVSEVPDGSGYMIAFLKNEYGTGGSSHALPGSDRAHEDHDAKGIGNRTYTDKKEAGSALIDMCRSAKQPNMAVTIGEYQGFKMSVSFDSFFSKFTISLKGSLSHEVEIGADSLGNLQRLSNALEGMTGKMTDVEQKLSNVEHQIETAKVEVTKPFAQEQELAEKLERLAELNALLNMDEKGDNVLDMGDDEPEDENGEQSTQAQEGESDRAEDIQEVADEPLKPVASFLMSERIAEHDKERMLADGSRGRVSVKEKLAEMKQKISDQKMPEKPKTKSQEASL